MNGFSSNKEASAIAELALAFHRSSASHPELLRNRRPLPPAVGILLRLAGGTASQELDPALPALAPADELRAAALFFIEQVLLQRGGSHYRVLGLPQDATAEQIKEHHRLLMRLFHPDRESLTDAPREEFAARINLAYNTLRDAGQRSSYDANLRAQRQAHRQTSPKPAVEMRRRKPESFWTVRAYPVLMRYLPQWVLAGTALISLIVVGAVYLGNPQLHESQTKLASGEVKETLPPAASPRTDGEGAGKLAEARVEPGQDLPAPDSGTVPASTDKPPQKLEAVALSAPAVEESKLKPGSSGNAPVAAVVSPADNQKLVPKTGMVTTPPAAEIAEPASAKLADSQASLPSPDPGKLLANFLDAYERGEVQSCMNMLDEGLRTNAGGKAELRREYEALFQNTDLRHVRILNINWSYKEGRIRGEGHYRDSLINKGETLLRMQSGQIRVEFVRRGEAALIKELYFLAGRT